MKGLRSFSPSSTFFLVSCLDLDLKYIRRRLSIYGDIPAATFLNFLSWPPILRAFLGPILEQPISQVSFHAEGTTK